MKIAIINGPNLNLVGVREPHIYGTTSLTDYLESLRSKYPNVEFSFFQSNHEGDLIDEIQIQGFECEGIVLNAGALTHYSYALADAVRAVETPVIEVHISDVNAREPFRRISVIKDACVAVIAGFGLKSYDMAVEWFIENAN
ncbi:MAG: 3-dehydroquinate dehydratase [Muribaculaceae bacterium]|nr:3-dehydroquinate dehydratase [Muribaculaceae bacterium]MBQ5466894.1 3-dehydroquinate dehydratase [Muribaculaceae bacterium]